MAHCHVFCNDILNPGVYVYFFKYCSPDSLRFGMLARGELFFASADELNDGSECRPRYVLKGSAELWYRFAYMLLLDACCFSNLVSTSCWEKIIDLAEPFGHTLKAHVGIRDIDFDAIHPVIHVVLPTNYSLILAGQRASSD